MSEEKFKFMPGDLVQYSGDYEPFIRRFYGCHLSVVHSNTLCTEVHLTNGTISLPSSTLTLIKSVVPLKEENKENSSIPPEIPDKVEFLDPSVNPAYVAYLEDEVKLLREFMESTIGFPKELL